MSKLPDSIAIGMSVEEDNPTLSAVLYLLNKSIESETELAIGVDVSGERRAWQCGRADALSGFKQVLEDAWKIARQQRGLPVE